VGSAGRPERSPGKKLRADQEDAAGGLDPWLLFQVLFLFPTNVTISTLVSTNTTKTVKEKVKARFINI
jgi:hypothetical protein